MQQGLSWRLQVSEGALESGKPRYRAKPSTPLDVPACVPAPHFFQMYAGKNQARARCGVLHTICNLPDATAPREMTQSGK